MLTRRAPLWMYAIAAIYVLAMLFNARQEVLGPENSGWVPSWPSLRVAGVRSGRPMDKAGLQAGDMLEAVNGHPVTGMPDWFLARAHFECNRPVELKIRRGEQPLHLKLTITDPSLHSWNFVGVFAFYIARFALLSMAIIVAFSRPKQLSARLAALMLAVGSVAEGYPSSGWAAALHHLPVVIAVPISLAVASCLLAPVFWLMFFSSFPRPRLSKRIRTALVFVPLVVFGIPIVISAVAIIYAPSMLLRPWPPMLSATPVSIIQDIAGVTPLLFMSASPFKTSIAQAAFLEAWFAVSVSYFAIGFVMLISNYLSCDEPRERRRLGMLCIAMAFFEVITIHNLLTRNWAGWFGSAPPAFFSGMTSQIAAIVTFLFVPLTLAYGVLTGSGGHGEN
jgi:hypothetical protein